MAEVDVKRRLKQVLANIERASTRRPPQFQCIEPRLVAATKTQPVQKLLEAYEGGQRHFGENYVRELEEKATHPLILDQCKGIKWHFIGHLQTNKIAKVLALPNLYLVETVDSAKLAAALNRSWPRFGAPGSRLKVMVQVNTSEEEAKNGVPPGDVTPLVRYVLEECPNLELDGLMTIGKYGYNVEEGPNPDFICLAYCREVACEELGLDWKTLNLSMGMSADYEQAVEMGSTNVRVGESIFGPRGKAVYAD